MQDDRSVLIIDDDPVHLQIQGISFEEPKKEVNWLGDSAVQRVCYESF